VIAPLQVQHLRFFLAVRGFNSIACITRMPGTVESTYQRFAAMCLTMLRPSKTQRISSKFKQPARIQKLRPATALT
jgi:hypothetical protein